ncbi:MAG: radical SAM protein [Clostridia bacterium]|jgi:hypothetical protein
MSKQYFSLFVTGKCNLNCKYCNQKEFRNNFQNYDMSLETIKIFCDKIENLPIEIEVALSGGEPTLWKNLTEGCGLIRECKNVIIKLNTNCIKFEIINELLKNNLIDVVFTDSANYNQLNADLLHYSWGAQVVIHQWENNQHKKPPVLPLEGVLPASCGCDKIGVIDNFVYICPNFYSIINRVGLNNKEFFGKYIYNIKEDWYNKLIEMRKEKYNMEVCKYCLGNNKVWNRLKEEEKDGNL